MMRVNHIFKIAHYYSACYVSHVRPVTSLSRGAVLWRIYGFFYRSRCRMLPGCQDVSHRHTPVLSPPATVTRSAVKSSVHTVRTASKPFLSRKIAQVKVCVCV